MSDGDSSFHLGSTSSFCWNQEIREQRERKRKRSNDALRFKGCIEGQHKHSDIKVEIIDVTMVMVNLLIRKRAHKNFVDSLLAQAEQMASSLQRSLAQTTDIYLDSTDADLLKLRFIELAEELDIVRDERDQAYQEADKAIMERERVAEDSVTHY
ncbi:hypothetical protein Hypma_004038 [Hypsizygus marmoreus]|uniref:Uncharacterized protein n=1 Tax=Hypsizygus marmoreus TaxID=39966 RepID=A0A369J795_HYPMA|nr:hypothetical protein Hypma_004038 [Hypsizygus marmoreus]